MDMPRGLGAPSAAQIAEDDEVRDHTDSAPDAAAAGITGDERRMQVRVYNHWAGLLNNRKFPSVEQLEPALTDDFGPFSVILDLNAGIEQPGIRFVGEKLAEECEMARDIAMLADVPPRSLLSRITDHYMQILANEAPIGFEAEFVNQRDETVLYRGILLPYSADDQSIDHIHGVINWKMVDDGANSSPIAANEGAPEAIKAEKKPVLTVSGDEAQPVGKVDTSDIGEGTAEIAPLEFGEAGLYDHLAMARELASEASGFEARSRKALYAALGQAYDFALAAQDEPEDFAEILADAGLKQQTRAPMTPIAKLVFGIDHDKKRLTEYATALAHAKRLALAPESFAQFLEDFDGALKGVVAAERCARRQENGKPQPRQGLDRKLTNGLSAIAPRQLDALAKHGDEFALVMIRRCEGGKIVVLDEVPQDPALVAKAARGLLKARNAS